MDTLLVDGDHYLGGRGLPVAVTGGNEIVQRALIRLSVRRGSFAEDRTLGSELHRLAGARPEARQRLALAYVQEALGTMTGVTVEEVAVEETGRETLAVAVRLGWNGLAYPLEVTVG